MFIFVISLFFFLYDLGISIFISAATNLRSISVWWYSSDHKLHTNLWWFTLKMIKSIWFLTGFLHVVLLYVLYSQKSAVHGPDLQSNLPDESISPFPNLPIFLGNSVSFDPIFTLKSKLLLSQPMRLAGLPLQFVDRIILTFGVFFFFLLLVFVGTYADFATKLLCFIFIVAVDTLLDIFMRIGFSF